MSCSCQLLRLHLRVCLVREEFVLRFSLLLQGDTRMTARDKEFRSLAKISRLLLNYGRSGIIHHR